jgi:RNA polymerase primary sigma factor
MASSNKKNTIRRNHAEILPAKEEKLLFRRARAGDEKARDKILQKYNDWVINIAKKYHACFPNMELTELMAEGNRGLLEALKRYNPSKSAKFSTYAWFWIIKNIQEYITSNLELIDIPRKVTSNLKKITVVMNDEIKKGKEPSIDKISHTLHLDVSSVREMLSDKKNITNPLSLDKYLDEEDQTQTMSETVEDKDEESIHDIIDRADVKISISGILKQLLPVEEKIIKLRFGFDDNRFHTLKEVGKKLDIPSSKVKDLETVAIFKLKKLLSQSNKSYDEYN